jgi:hypothetical protein
MTNCENWAAIRARWDCSMSTSNGAARSRFEIDLGDYRILRPEVRADLGVTNGCALGYQPHGDSGVRHFPQQIDRRIEHPTPDLVVDTGAVIVGPQKYDVSH